MREDEFRKWLEAKDITTVSHRMSRVRTVEAALQTLGSQAETLDEAFEQDGLAQVTSALAELARTASPGIAVPVLLPNGSSNPGSRLRNLAAALRNYRQFANGEPPLPAPDDQDEAEGGPNELTKEAVEAAMDECDRMGQDAFLSHYGFGQSRDYRVVRGNRTYPSKAIAGVAFKYVPGGAARKSTGFNGGYGPGSACRLLEAVGFEIVHTNEAGTGRTELRTDALEALKRRFLDEFPDFESDGFAVTAGSYYETEDEYKRALIDQAARALSEDGLSDADLGRRLLDILTGPGSNLLLSYWKSQQHLATVREANPDLIEHATGRLARSKEAPEQTAQEFLDAVWPLISAGQEKNMPYGDSRILPTTLLALVRPSDAIAVRYRKFKNLGLALLGNSIFGNNPLTRAEHSRVLELSRALFDIMKEQWGWGPRDLWDVQGFIWVTCEKGLDMEAGTVADRIRQYALDAYIIPARQRGEGRVTIKAGDVHNALGLHQAHANVCQSLGGSKFTQMAQLEPPTVTGPQNSSTTAFTFQLRGNVISEWKLESDAANLILYGPPGTGKTYETAAEAVKLCDGVIPAERNALMARYQELVEARRIDFVTFHQSYSYEEFVESLRPVQGQEGSEQADQVAAGFSLQPEDGLFRRIARRAAASKGSGGERFQIGDRRVFKLSIGEAANPDDDYLFEEALNDGHVLLGYDDIDWSRPEFGDRDAIIRACEEYDRKHPGPERQAPNPYSGRVQCPMIFRNWVEKGDLIVVSKGNLKFRAIAEVIGDYEYAPRPSGLYSHRRKVRWLWVDKSGAPVEEIFSKRFSQRAIYVIASGELNVAALEGYINSQAEGSDSSQPDPFVLIIDEINRGNVSKIFGELITLIEPDKRLGRSNALEVRLPYSREAFGIPANLHIIGTMNTADRSIALLDTALRRRFQFREVPPQPKLLADVVEGVPLRKMLEVINDRIEFLIDRDHCIGHAFFMGNAGATREAIDATMRHKVIPLLQEYFFEDWRKMAMVLGDADAAPGQGAFIIREQLSTPPGCDDASDGERWRWRVREDRFPDQGYDRFL